MAYQGDPDNPVNDLPENNPLPPLNQNLDPRQFGPSGAPAGDGSGHNTFDFDSAKKPFTLQRPKKIWPYLLGLGLLGLLILIGFAFCDGGDDEDESTPAAPTAVPEPTLNVAELVAEAMADMPPVEVTRIVQVQVPVTRLVEDTAQANGGQQTVNPPPQVQPYPQLPLYYEYTPEHFQQEYVNCFSNPRESPDVIDQVKWMALLDLSASARSLWEAYYMNRTCDVPNDVAEMFGEQRIKWFQRAIYGNGKPAQDVEQEGQDQAGNSN